MANKLLLNNPHISGVIYKRMMFSEPNKKEAKEELKFLEFNFSEALERMKNRKKVARAGWNGAKSGRLDMFTKAQFRDKNSANTNPYLYMVVGDDRTPWHPSNLDFFADDWYEVE